MPEVLHVPATRRRARPWLFVLLAVLLVGFAVALVVMGVVGIYFAPVLGALAVVALIAAAWARRVARKAALEGSSAPRP